MSEINYGGGGKSFLPIISGFNLGLAVSTSVGLRMARAMVGSRHRADLVVSWQPGSKKIGRG